MLELATSSLVIECNLVKYSTTKNIKFGVPQGVFFSTLLLNIYINDIGSATTRIGTVLYADDTEMYTKHCLKTERQCA